MSQFDPQAQTQQQQPPVAVYPNTVTRQPPSSSSSSSSSDNGSFGTVFIVLAVIIVISGIACCIGRLCNKSVHKNKPPKHSHNFNPKDRVKEKEPREREREMERDLEFGFDKNIAASKPAGKGEAPNGFGFKMPEKGQHIKFEPRVRGSNGPGKSFKIASHEDGDIKFEPNKFGDFGHHKASG